MDAFNVFTRWMLATLCVLGAVRQSESITLRSKPENPKIVVLGVNSNAVSLKWNFFADSGETIQSVIFKRQKPGDIQQTQIASRGPNEGFTMQDPFNDVKKYRALLDSELKIFNVQRDEEYVYTLMINYRTSGGVFSTRSYQVLVDVKVPPKITIAPIRKLQRSIGQNYTLRCNASGDPHPNITWTKDGVPVNQFNASGYLLHLVNVQREDAGSYRCTASNGYGDDATSVSIVSIQCNHCQTRIVGITLRNVEWKSAYSNQASVEFRALESQLLSAISAVYSKNSGKQLYRLAVAKFSPGSVVATVELVFGKSVSDPLKPLQDEINDGKLGSFTVDRVLDLNPTIMPSTGPTSSNTMPPQITIAPAQEPQLSIGQNYTLRCNASGDPHPNITWTKDGVPVNQFNASGYLLHLVNVQREDAGSYRCTASNGYGDDATSVSIVSIKLPPKISIAPVREPQLSVGQNYTLKCNASGDPHPNITWTKDGVPVNQFNASGYLLHLVNVQREDAGSYRCTASNGYGDDATSVSIVSIKLTTLTNPPTGSTSVATDTSWMKQRILCAIYVTVIVLLV